MKNLRSATALAVILDTEQEMREPLAWNSLPTDR